MIELSQEVAETLTEMENCFRLLLPDPFDFTVSNTGLEPNEQTSADKDTSASSLSSCVGCVDDEQPCCSKDILPVSQCVRMDQNEGLGDKQKQPEQNVLDGETCSEVETGVPVLGDDDYETFVRNHGLISHKYTLDLELSTGTCTNFSQRAGDNLCDAL